MADEDDGATPSELLLEACRRNNAPLLQTVLSQFQFHPHPPKPPSSTDPSSATHPPTTSFPLSTLLNSTLDPLGRTPLHICASSGADEVLDLLLDQEGVEVEPTERHGGDTPLHCAVRYAVDSYTTYLRDRAAATAPPEVEEEEVMKGVMAGVELLLDAGADPRIRNEGGRGVKAVGLLVGGARGEGKGKGGWGVLREVLVKSEDELNVREVLDREVEAMGHEEEGGGPTGSQSDSD